MMKLARLMSGVVLGAFLVAQVVFVLPLFAQPSPTINYQGKLTDATGLAVPDGLYDMEFRLYTTPTGGSAIWTETLNTLGTQVQVQNGLFSVMLGSTTPLTSVDFNQPLYLGVNIESDGEMTPRKILGTVPAAFEAQRVGGVASTSFLRADQDDTASGLLTFTGGLLSSASSTIQNLTTNTATTTNLVINGERFSNLLGTGLTNNAGTLTVATSTLGLGNGTFLGLSDTPSTYNANRVLYTSGSAVVDNSNLTFNGTRLQVGNGGSSLGTSFAVGRNNPGGLNTGALATIYNRETSTTAGITTGLNTLVFAEPTGTTERTYLGSISGVAGGGLTVPRAVGNMTGFQGSVFADNLISDVAIGVLGFISIGDPDSIIGDSYGVSGEIAVTAGQATNVSGVRSIINIDGGFVDTAIGVNVFDHQVSAGSLDTAIGVYIDEQTAGSLLNFGLYAAGTTTTNVILGNLGLGTTTPSHKLTVEGDVRITGALVDNASSTGSNGMVLQSTGSGFTWVATSTLGISGVSTLAALTDVSISGPASGQLLSYNGSSWTNIATSTLGFASAFSNSAQLAALLSDETGTGNVVFSVSPTFTGTINAAAATLSSTLTLSGTAANIALGSNFLSGDGGDEGIFIDASGNVGIGTTTPEARLDLHTGGIRVFGDIQTDQSTFNTFVGVGVAPVNTASFNTGIGLSALASNTNGSSNTAIGAGTLSSNVGGISNTAIGVGALAESVTGSRNIAIGLDAGRYTNVAGPLTSINNSLFLGEDTRALANSDTNTIVIGQGARGLGSNTIVLGNDSITTTALKGSVGIGTTTPSQLLTVAGGVRITGALVDNASSTGSNGMVLQSTGTGFSWVATSTLGFASAFSNSAQLAALLSDETGTGNVVFSASPTFTGTINAAAATLSSTLTLSGSAANIALGSNFLSGDGGDEGIFVDAAGRVGIGTSTPNSQLTIQGAAGSTSTLRVASSTGATTLELLVNGNLELPGQLISAGINWTARSAAGNDDDWDSVTYGNGLFVTVSTFGDNRVMTSPDGITWTARSAAGDNDYWYSVTYGNGLFVAVGDTFGGADTVMTSPDGITWTARSAAGDNDTWQSITYGNGLFVAVSVLGDDRVMTSPDGITWTARSAAGNNDSWYSVTYGNSLFVAVGTGLDVVMTSGFLNETRLATNNLRQGGFSLFGNAQIGTTTLSTVGTNAQLSIQTNGTADILNLFRTNGTQALTVLESGNVGIGTSTPSQLLTVAGNVRITGALFDSTNASGTAGQVLQSTGSGFNWVATSTLGFGAAFSNSAQLAALLSDETGTGNVVFSASPTLTGTLTAAAANFSSTLSLTGSAANIALGSNWLSGDGGDEGIFIDASGNVGIGTTTPNSRLTIQGDINISQNNAGLSFMGTRFFYASTTNDSIAIGENAGATFNANTTNNIAIGFEAGRFASTTFTEGNVMIGDRAGRNLDGLENTVIGVLAGNFNSGDYNTLIGRGSGQSNSGSNNFIAGGFDAGFSNGGDENVIIGEAAGYSNLGTRNILLGSSAGGANSGNENNIFGDSAGDYNEGSFNNFFGSSAGRYNLGNYNEFIGFEAGALMNASGTVAIGGRALRSGSGSLFSFENNATTSNNTVIGYGAGFNTITGGDNNILIGYQAADNLTTGANNIIIGYDIDNVTAGASNQLNIGNLLFGTGVDGTGTTLSTGNIGIGTTTPSQRLTVAGNVRITGALFDSNNASGTAGQVLQSTGTGFTWVATSTLGFGSAFSNSAQLAALLSDETGTGNVVFSASPTFTGTINAAAATLSSTLTLSGSAANIALGSNWLSGDGDDEGVFVSGTGNVGIGTIPVSDGRFNVSWVPNNSTANTEYGSYVFMQDRGPISSGTDTTYGSFILAQRPGFASGGDTSIIGQGISVTGTAATADNSTAVGLSVSVSGADVNYSGLFTGGNFGIGTTTPGALLDVQGAAQFGSGNVNLVTSAGQLAGLSSTFVAAGTSANFDGIISDNTGSGALVFGTSPTLITPNLGTPSSLVLTNATGLPIVGGTTGTLTETRGGTNQTTYTTGDFLYASGANTLAKRAIGTTGQILSVSGGLPTWTSTSTLGLSAAFSNSAQLAALLSDETGTGNVVFSASPTFTSTINAAAATLSSTLTLSGSAANIALGSNFLSGDGGDEGIFIDASGNVGIGTSTPSNSLHIIAATSGNSVQAKFENTTVGEPAGFQLANEANGWRVNFRTNPTNGWFEIVSGSGSVQHRWNAKDYLLASDGRLLFSSETNFASAGVAAADTNLFRDSANVLRTNDSFIVDGNIGIGTTTPSQRLTVAGGVRITGALVDNASSSGSTGQVLQSTGSGFNWVATSTLGFASAFSNSAQLAALLSDETGTGNVVFSASPTFTGTLNAAAATLSSTLTLSGTAANIALGSNFLSGDGGDEGIFVTSTGNVGIGTSTVSSRLTVDGDINLSTGSIIRYNGGGLLSANDVNYNVAFGVNEFGDMHSGVTGSYNTFFGISAGADVTSGSNNVLLGKGAGFSLTTEDSNTLIGYNAGVFATGLTNNIGIGSEALRNSTSTFSIGIGQQAGAFGGGASNIMLGNFSGGEAFGNNNIFIGNSTGISPSIGSNNILIGDGINLPTSNTSNFLSLGNALYGNLITGNIGIGTTTPSSRLALQVNTLTGTGTAALDQWITTTNSSNGATQFGNSFNLTASNTATTTIIGSILRVADSTTFGNTVRALEVQSNRGTNTQGENTAISGTARTFGIRGITEGDAGGVLEPAGGFFQTRGTTQGNAIRGYSSSITSATLMSLFHDTSAFTGTGLELNFGNSGGSFSSSSSRFVDFRNTNTSVFTVSAFGTTTIGNGTDMAGLQIGRGGICVDNDGACAATVQGRIASVSQFTGNSDLAETYFSSQSLQTGEIVTLAGELSVARARKDAATPIIGVVSTKPGVLMGADDESTRAGETAFPIALSGRVPIILSNENGPIKKGDQLMLSSIPGVAMRATATGTVVGIALEDFDESRKYSRTYINQFGDDLVDPIYQPITDPNDPRVHDGCFYGGGGDIGAPCIPLDGESIIEHINSANQVLAEQSVAEQLAVLARTPSETRVVNGRAVQVGQIVMFVDLSYRWLDDTQLAALATFTSTSSIQTVGENEDETLFDRMVTLAQNFVDGILQVVGIKAERVEVQDELCVDGVCINGDQLRQLLEGTTPSPSTSASPSPTPSPTPTETTPVYGPIQPPSESESTPEPSGGTGESPVVLEPTPPVVEDTPVEPPAPPFEPAPQVSPEEPPTPEPIIEEIIESEPIIEEAP